MYKWVVEWDTENQKTIQYTLTTLNYHRCKIEDYKKLPIAAKEEWSEKNLPMYCLD